MKTLLILLLMLFSTSTFSVTSTCYGETKKGHLANGVELPSKGNNFVTYSNAARLAGRNYVHSTVRDIIVASYKTLEKEQPSKVYKYAETGFKQGGPFKPHKTHQNGLSVDFMTPVTNSEGKSVHLPTNPFNKFGYNIEFDASDKFKDYSIDYEAMAAHVVQLHKQALAHGVEIWRVIFDPKLTPNLYKTEHSEYLRSRIQFSKKRSWVRHDEHYHVDFSIPCQ